jgi:polyhydroxyalkanoate synthase
MGSANGREGPVDADSVYDAVDGAELLDPMKPRAIVKSVMGVALHSRHLGRRGVRFGLETAKIAAGRSAVEPAKNDWRFKDDAWRTNPVYHRWMQLYLAWAESVMGAVADARLGDREADRTRFCLEALTTAAAPTNTLVGNPAAIKRAFDTSGASLVRGVRNAVDDARTNNRMPRQVAKDAYTIGSDLAATPGSVVYRDEICEVLQFAPAGATTYTRPMLMVAPQINKYYFMDLAPGRSFVEYAVSRGLGFFAISWRNPGEEQAGWSLDDYAAAEERAIDVVRDISKSDDVNLISLCAGGILSAGLLSHMAAESDTRVNSASFGVTLLDFDTPAPVGMFRVAPLLSFARDKSKSDGILEGRSLGAMFAWMRPNDLVWNYYVNNYLLGEDPPRFDILAWNADATNLPGRLHGQFLDIFQHNQMVQKGALDVLGSPVDLSKVTIDTYVTGATKDHLTPWRGCFQTTRLLPGNSTFVLSNAGHIASLINPPGNPKAHYFAGPEPDGDADAWQKDATRQQGTWWEHWADWASARSGEERKAPAKLGNRRHPPIEPAPGQYVRG